MFALHACLGSCLGLGGVWLLFRRGDVRAGLLLTLPLLLFPVPYYITHAEFRYRLVIDPLITVLGWYAIAWRTGERKVSAAAAVGEVAVV